MIWARLAPLAQVISYQAGCFGVIQPGKAGERLTLLV
jgi:hypothetical protein